jgi:hypothetical protein
LDARRNEQIDAVIRQLTRDDHELPSPFSKRELYRTAASVGIEIWKPAVKNRFTDRILDRLNYEWDSASRTFTPVVTEQLIEDIQRAARTITPTFITGLSDPLRKRVQEWCDLHGLGSFETRPVQRIIARQAILCVLLKAALYEWYQRRGVVPPLTDTVQQMLQNARSWTDDVAFDTFVLDYIAELADEGSLIYMVTHRERLLYSAQPAEDIGRIYAALTPNEYRQTLGQFRTPPEIAEAMQSWAAHDVENLLDPGLGAGVLSSPYHPRWDLDSTPAHISGSDRSQLSLLMGSTALTLSGQGNHSRAGDFLDLRASDLQRDVDGIVCNPPYTSGDALPKEYKNQINTNLEEITGIDISARSPLYTYFMFHARSFLSPGDRAAFLTPDSFLATDYGESLKQFLLNEFAITAFVQFDPEGDSVFADAQVTALLSFVEATTADHADGITRFIRVDESVEASTLRDAVQNGAHGETDWGFINHVQQAELSPENNWAARFVPCDIDISGLTPLGKFVSVHRGKSTGDVDFFCLTQDDVDEAGIPDQHLSRLIRRPNLTAGYDFCEDDWEELRTSGEEVWLLDPDELPRIPESISAFDRQGVTDCVSVPNDEPGKRANTVTYLQRAITERDLTGTNALETRPYWYRPRRQPSPRVLVQDAGRDGFAFVLNETTARNINNFRGLYDVTIGETELKALLAYLNSTIGQQVIQTQTQTQQGGYEKLSISALKSLPVIDPESLENPTVTALADLFDELRKTAREDGDCDSVLDRLDSLLQQVM